MAAVFRLMPVTAVLGVRAVTRFGRFLAMSTPPVERLDQVDRTLLERYLAFLHSELRHTKTIRNHLIGQLNLFLGRRTPATPVPAQQ
ncbi:hypothetical protein [Nonomuraea sp. GTA35]|uniref:hypothetical protein n=1 Tax=Nonomuraea sp. GTA35 TaxID=1676746 RepID=UPI0035BEDE31